MKLKNSAVKGKYRPQNIYKTPEDSYIYRSLWERRFMLYCDRSDSIVYWSNEQYHVPYVSPKDGKWHNYYPDFYVKYIDKKGNTREKIVEIKPYYQKSWDVNKAKWKYAEEWCTEQGYEFQVLTEKELF